MNISDVKYMREAISDSYSDGAITQSAHDSLMRLINDYLDLELYCHKLEYENNKLTTKIKK